MVCGPNGQRGLVHVQQRVEHVNAQIQKLTNRLLTAVQGNVNKQPAAVLQWIYLVGNPISFIDILTAALLCRAMQTN